MLMITHLEVSWSAAFKRIWVSVLQLNVMFCLEACQIYPR